MRHDFSFSSTFNCFNWLAFPFLRCFSPSSCAKIAAESALRVQISSVFAAPIQYLCLQASQVCYSLSFVLPSWVEFVYLLRSPLEIRTRRANKETKASDKPKIATQVPLVRPIGLRKRRIFSRERRCQTTNFALLSPLVSYLPRRLEIFGLTAKEES